MAENGNPLIEPYTPKNILITGGAGFIASHVVIRIATLYPQYKVWGGWRAGSCSGHYPSA